MKSILINMGSSDDVIFQSNLRQMEFNETKIEKVNENLVGFIGELSVVIKRSLCHCLQGR